VARDDVHDDIEFDFFEDSPTSEAAAVERPAPRGPRRPVRPPSGVTPLLRLIGLIAFAILLVVLLVFWVQSCRGASKKSTYSNYMEDMSRVAADSSQVGTQLNTLLTTRGLKQADLRTQLSGLAQQQQQVVNATERINPPGRLRDEHSDAVEAMQFRVSGLRGLANAFTRTAQLKDADQAARLLAAQARRLDTSDVVWDDRFKDPSKQVLRDQAIGGVVVPNSHFVKTAELTTAPSLKLVWQRIHGASTAAPTTGGLHGNGILSTKVLPSGQELSQDSETTIVATSDLAFVVAVQNSGDSQEVQVPVTLTVKSTPNNLAKTQTIDLINPGQTKTLTFRDLGQPPFGNKTTVSVDVKPVQGEKNTSNNSATYPVFFSVSGG
jgi:CARDB